MSPFHLFQTVFSAKGVHVENTDRANVRGFECRIPRKPRVLCLLGAATVVSTLSFAYGCHPSNGRVDNTNTVARHPSKAGSRSVTARLATALSSAPPFALPHTVATMVVPVSPFERPVEQENSPVFPARPATQRLTVTPGKKAVRGAGGIVVSVNALATKIGLAQLAAKGNAVDAAIATAFALAVTHPSAGNLGGGGFALVRLPNGETHALDFRESSPQTLNKERYFSMVHKGGLGPDSIAVPGTVAGLCVLHERFGKIPLEKLVEPAQNLAKNGHVIQKREAEAIAVSWSKLKHSPLGRRRWGSRDGLPLTVGQVVKLPELAATLDRIRTEGSRGFYEGGVAESIREVSGEPPQLDLADLKTYRAIWRRPMTFDYRGLVITTMPPPSAGGVALMTGLLQLGQYDVANFPLNSVSRAHLLLEVLRRAQADRLYGVSDPDALSLEEQTQREARWFDAARWASLAPIGLDTATPNERITDGIIAERESDQTTHLAVVDAEGMAVSLTTTLSSGFGSKVVTRTGIVLNNSLGSFSAKGKNQPAEGRRTISSMAPTLVDDIDGLRLVLGTPGGDSIPSTLLQLIQLLVDYQLALDEAVDAPRLHQSAAGKAFARGESNRPIPRGLRMKLERMGHHFTTPTAYMGHANSIVLSDRVAYGYVDPREGGLALGLPSPSP